MMNYELGQTFAGKSVFVVAVEFVYIAKTEGDAIVVAGLGGGVCLKIWAVI